MNKRLAGLLSIALLLPVLLASAATGRTPEDVIRLYTKYAVAHDLDAFISLHDPDVKKFKRVEETGEFQLTTSGREQVRAKYQANFARTADSPVQVEILEMITIGEIVVSRDRVTGLPDNQVADELTIYQVRDGLVRTIWYMDQKKTTKKS